MKLSLSSHHEAILWPQLVVSDLRLSGQVWGCVVVWRNKLGVLVLMELIRSRLQHTLLQFNTPLELHIPKRTKRHEEAKQPVLMKKTTERSFSKCNNNNNHTEHISGCFTCRITVFLSDGGCSPRIRATSSSFWALWSLESV